MTGTGIITEQWNEPVRQLDTEAYLTVLRQLVESGREVNLRISGSSMAPFLIHQRDVVYFGPVKEPLKRGKIVFYQRDNGQFVVHRIYRVRGGDCWFLGDAQQEVEGPLSRDHIFAEVTAVSRKGKMIRPGDFWWEFFARVWLRMVPFRQTIMKIYGWSRR